MPLPPGPLNIAGALSPVYFATIFMVYETTSLLNQAFRYFPRCRQDSLVLRIGAVHLITLTLFQTGLQLWNTWNTLVSGFGNVTNAFNVGFAAQIQPLLTVFMAFPLQVLMVYRCISFLKLNLFLASPYVLLLAFATAAGLAESIIVLTFDFNSPIILSDPTVLTSPMWLLSSAVMDSATSISLIVHLLRSKQRSSSRRLHKLISRAVHLIWEVALPPSICAVVACIAHFLISVIPPPSNALPWSVAFINVLGQLYALSYFITLNFHYDVQREKQNQSQLSDVRLSRPADTKTPTVRDGQIRVEVETFKEFSDTYLESRTYRSGQGYIDPERGAGISTVDRGW